MQFEYKRFRNPENMEPIDRYFKQMAEHIQNEFERFIEEKQAVKE